VTNTPNASEREFWSGPSGQSWITHETVQDMLLSEASGAIVARAVPQPGQRVLDIGCGTGALSRAIADRVGAGGHVLSVDISEPLLARATEHAEGRPEIAMYLGDAQTADWPESGFDMAVSRFGVMFFADPPAAFANIARALRPGGRMVFGAWGPVSDNPWWSVPSRVASERLGQPPKTSPNSPGPMGLADSYWALEQFRLAGLEDVACEKATVALLQPAGVLAAAELATRVGPGARILRMFDGTEDDRLAIRNGIAEAFADYAAEDGARIPAMLHIFTARRG
jgi:SAM-dependent methyltransferase